MPQMRPIAANSTQPRRLTAALPPPAPDRPPGHISGRPEPTVRTKWRDSPLQVEAHLDQREHVGAGAPARAGTGAARRTGAARTGARAAGAARGARAAGTGGAGAA